jgi:hypothetical protein
MTHPLPHPEDATIIDEPHVPTADEMIEQREAAIRSIGLLPETYSYTIYCQRTGVPIANMQLLQQAGKLPYLANWKDNQAFHPLFSLSQNQLLAWTRKNWNALFRNTVDRTTEVQRQQFQIAFMAVLHSMKCIDQQHPALPSFHTVNANMQRLLELAYWQNFLDSARFKFPTLRINKLNANTNLSDIGTYLDICESVKHDYETNKQSQFEEAKLEAARRAEKSVRSGHIKAVSKKALWNWFLSSIAEGNSKKYSLPEWVEWKEQSAKLWLANESQQLQFSLEDVDTIEEVFYAECSLGTSVSNHFKQELNKIRENIHNHLTIFEIDWSTTMQQDGVKRVDAAGNELSAAIAPAEPGAEPQINEFHSRVDYIRAKAKWDVANMQYNAWKAKQEKNDGN